MIQNSKRQHRYNTQATTRLTITGIAKYESGSTLPSAEVLAAFVLAGIDVLYILVGTHNAEQSIARDRFRRAFEEVSRQAKANREQLSDDARLDIAWRIYDAFSTSETTKSGGV